LSNAQSIFDNHKVTNAAVLEATRNVENEISRLENLSVELRNIYNDLNSKLTSIGVSSSTAGYKAIYDDLAVANNVINSSSPEISTINANISTLQYYLNIWDSHLSGGRYKIIKGTFGDSFATFIYPSKISMETGQSFADLGYEFIVDANYNPTNSDYRIFFDAGGWGNKANVISEYFTNYTYTATHSVGGDATAGNWSFQNYENQTSVNGNWRFASVTYNSKPYLLVSAGNQSYKSRINVTSTASKIGKFTYTHTMQSLADGRGAWDERKMKFFDRTLCNMLQKAVAKKDPANYEPWETALVSALGKTCDWTDKKYLQPLIEYMKNI